MDNAEEEIQENIEIEEDNNDIAPHIQCTYDKFLIESTTFPNKKPNVEHVQLKNQMINIISDIKYQKEQASQNKKNILQQLSNKFAFLSEDNQNTDEVCNAISENTRIENTTNNNNNNHHTTSNRENTLFQSTSESHDQLYNINFDEYIKQNTLQRDNTNDNNNNNGDYSNNDYNYITFQPNNIKIQNQNETVDNPYIHNMDNNINHNNILEDKEEISVVNNNNNNQYDIQEQIMKNYNQFILNTQKQAKNQITAKYNKQNDNNNNNNTTSKYKDQRLILVDSCSNDEERLIKQKKLEQLKEKKIRSLENKNRNLKSKSKPKVIQPTSKTNNKDNTITSASSNQPSSNRPFTSKNNRILPSISSNNKNQLQTNNTNISLPKQRPKSTKQPRNIISSSKASCSFNNNNNNISNCNDNSSSNSRMSRVPVKIRRDKAILANQKVKNVKCSKMSNKNTIKKAIRDVCLAGIHYKDTRDKIIEVIDSCDAENYIILFKGDYGFYLHGVYTYEPSDNTIELLTCINNAPNYIDTSMVAKFFKYNLSQNQFKELNGNKEFNVIVDGITISTN